MHPPSPSSANSVPRSLRDWLEQIARWNPPPPADRRVAEELAPSHSRVPVPPGTESLAVEPLASWLEPGDRSDSLGQTTPAESSEPLQHAAADTSTAAPSRTTEFPIGLADRSPRLAPVMLAPLPENDRSLSDLLVRGLDSSRASPPAPPTPSIPPMALGDTHLWAAPDDQANDAGDPTGHEEAFRPIVAGGIAPRRRSLALPNAPTGRAAGFPRDIPFAIDSAAADRDWPPEPGFPVGRPREPYGGIRDASPFEPEPESANWQNHWTELARRVTDLESALAEG